MPEVGGRRGTVTAEGRSWHAAAPSPKRESATRLHTCSPVKLSFVLFSSSLNSSTMEQRSWLGADRSRHRLCVRNGRLRTLFFFKQKTAYEMSYARLSFRRRKRLTLT